MKYRSYLPGQYLLIHDNPKKYVYKYLFEISEGFSEKLRSFVWYNPFNRPYEKQR